MDPHESDATFAEIGRVVVRWADLEIALGTLVTYLLDDFQRYTRIVSAELGYRSRLELAKSLYLERHGKDEGFEALQKLEKRIEAAAELRNSIVHSSWRSAGASQKITRIKSTAKGSRGFSTKVQNYTVNDLRKRSDEIVKIREDLVALIHSWIEAGKAFNNPVGEEG